MKRKALYLIIAALALSAPGYGFDGVITAKVVYIDEWDTGYTRVQIDSPSSCGSMLFWMDRSMTGYNVYMARVLAALTAHRPIRIAERAPGYCDGTHLYNPRIGIM
jgi:hypothetical protein